jgi:shikimate dehydrogenase
MNNEIWRFGLIGWPLEHSYSRFLHRAAISAAGLSGDYSLLPVPPMPGGAAELWRLLEKMQHGSFDGLNVTIPHKRSVLPYLDRLSETASGIGAVNTILCRDGRLIGENTDAPGFMTDLDGLIRAGDMRAVILGAGGAARAAAYGLLSAGWDVVLLARRLDQAAAAVRDLSGSIHHRSGGEITGGGLIAASTLDRGALEKVSADCSLIVNATPLGMFPEIERSPWPADLQFPEKAALYDMVYNPLQTKLVRDAKSAGLFARGGVGMLVEQAALAFELWTGIEASRSAMLSSVAG